MLPKALCGLDRHSALFDHQAITIRGGGDGASDGFNSAEVGFPVFQRRRSNADENRASLLYSYFWRGELQAASSHIALDQQVEVGFKKGEATSVELLQLFRITIHTENLMTYFREPSVARQATTPHTTSEDFPFSFSPLPPLLL